jgi:mRNA interferase RelE/StbE
LAWRIDYTANALGQLRRLDRQISERISDYMERRIALLADPRSAGVALTGRLGGYWRYRVGDYRIICVVEDDVLRVLVVRVGHRREVYRRD